MTGDDGVNDDPGSRDAASRPSNPVALAAIEGLVRAFALDDVEGFIDHLTEDAVLEPPPF